MKTASPSMKRWLQILAIVAIFSYCTVFLVNTPGWVPIGFRNPCRDAQNLAIRTIHRGVMVFTGNQSPGELTRAMYFLLIAGLIPLLAARMARRGLPDLGWRRPNWLALRYFFVALVISTPFLIWMVNSPTIGASYLKQLGRLGFVAFAAYYLVNMFTEHLLLHGIVLSLSRPDGRWPGPSPLPLPGKGPIGILRWLGLAMPRTSVTGQRMSVWLGLAPGCLMPMFFSALLFGMVHLGKDTRELVLSFPGGLAQAYIAYRSNSWFTPFLIHLATASIALAMMAWM